MATLKKGQRFVRKCDRFVFVVEKTGCRGKGAILQCVDAARISGWFWKTEIERDFERV